MWYILWQTTTTGGVVSELKSSYELKLLNTKILSVFIPRYSQCLSRYSQCLSRYSQCLSQDTHSVYQDTHSVYQDTHSIYQDTHIVYQDTHSVYQDTYSVYQDTHIVYLQCSCKAKASLWTGAGESQGLQQCLLMAWVIWHSQAPFEKILLTSHLLLLDAVHSDH